MTKSHIRLRQKINYLLNEVVALAVYRFIPLKCIWVEERCGGYRITCRDFYQRCSGTPNPAVCHHCNRSIISIDLRNKSASTKESE